MTKAKLLTGYREMVLLEGVARLEGGFSASRAAVSAGRDCRWKTLSSSTPDTPGTRCAR
ncbi:hypothetical protein [Brevundimonas sp.]|uniref:hypothetical protein n=1 Tax=Brevundimonas sp. TaxID=1871086 RepID=UPI00248982CF|nr:hypothetical protein [Brevundimonas sp.]MDI1282514.1 hypothetical protein [Brevundimonas sp.]